MKNPKWQRDELILALELYFRMTPGEIHARNQEIIELSHLLNLLPIHPGASRNQKFRNPNGVSLKLSNFLSLDPSYSGKGMTRISKMDEQIFSEFREDKEKLTRIATQIQWALSNDILRAEIYMIEDEVDIDSIRVTEGTVLYKLHKSRERNPQIVKRKKTEVKREQGKLACEICDFDFEEVYGELGKDFIECHHLIPLSDVQIEKETSLEDLALVCSNCHRMLHRGINTLTLSELRRIMKKK